MKTLYMAAYEFKYLVRSFQTLVIFLAVFGFWFVISANGIDFQSSASGGIVFANAPTLITIVLLTFSVFSVFVAPFYTASPILKDVESRFDGILFATPISKTNYLFGRFLGGLSAQIVVLSAAPLGLLLGTLTPWAPPETLGPVNIWHYAVIYMALVVPTLIAVSALMLAIVVFSGRVIYAYLAALVLLGSFFLGNSTLLISPPWDPFMYQTFTEATSYWTATEHNNRLAISEGLVVTNRLIWLCFSGILLAAAYMRFSFRVPAKQVKVDSRKQAADKVRKTAIDVNTDISPTWERGTHFQQFLFRTKFETLSVVRSVPFLVLMSFMGYLAISAMNSSSGGMYGNKSIPETWIQIETLEETVGLMLLAVLTFYSAEIVWRDRASGFSEFIDAMPVPNWVLTASKMMALGCVIIAIEGLGIAIAIAFQLIHGSVTIDLTLYAERELFLFSTKFLVLAVLACLCQVLARSRVVGMMLFAIPIGFLILKQFLPGAEHPLISFGFPDLGKGLSGMNGNDRFVDATYWLRLYWVSIAGFLVLLTYVFWNRGVLQPLKYRLRNFKVLKSGSMLAAASVLFAVFIGSGGYIYYNINILNDYYTRAEKLDALAAYEQKYEQYADLPLPRIVGVKIDVDIYPYKRRVEARATHILQNKTDEPIHSVHLTFPTDVAIPEVFLHGAVLSSVDEVDNYYIFDLEKPMHPAERRTLTFQTQIQQVGFTHDGEDVELVRNGSSFRNNRITPKVGFDYDRTIKDRLKRKDYRLPALAAMKKLEHSDRKDNNLVRSDSDFVTFETTVSTTDTQIAVAPGYLEREWLEGNRRYFTYKMDAPMINYFGYVSADYEVVRDHWNDVSIEVFHHKPHTYNIDRMIASVKDSLAYFEGAFSPYQYKQFRIMEYPAYRSRATAFANTIPYSESIGFLTDIADEQAIDQPYYVTAHEVAHQWWAHQVMPANRQGGRMLTETLAQYSAILVMERKYGGDNIRKFLKYELDQYLNSRGLQAEGELPLYKVEEQDAVAYQKGSVIMYGLKDYVGEDVINRSLQRLISLRAYSSEPYATTTDFLDILREEAGPEHNNLIVDLFEKITLYDLKISRSSIEELETGDFKVTLDLEVAKYYSDALGNQTEAAFDLPVDIGLFLESPDDTGYGAEDILMLEKRRVKAGQSSVEIIVDKRPRFAGIDPYHKLIDRNSDDNLHAINAED